MKWWGALSCLLVSQGLAQGPGGPSQCQTRCMQANSVHTNEFEQINPALEACQRGCEFFSRIEFRNGVQEPLNTLRNCNYSCDERYDGPGNPGLPACQSGCGFHFDNDVTKSPPSQSPPQGQNIMRTQTFIRPDPSRPTILSARSDQPLPIIMRQEPSRPTIMRSEPPRPTITMMRSEPPRQPIMRSEPPRPMMTMRSQNPFMNLLRSQGPLTLRSQNTPIIPQIMSEMSPRPMNMSPSLPSPEGPVVTKQNPNGPTIIGFSLPQLLSRVNSIIPRMDQAAAPRVMEISMRNPFRDFQRPSMSLPEMPRMVEGFFGRKDDDIEPFIEETLFGDDEAEDFIPEGPFGRKDDDIEPFGGFEGLFEQINNHMGRLMSAMPQQNQSLVNRKDDIDPFKGLFEQITNHIGGLMNPIPQKQSLLGHKDDDIEPFAEIKGLFEQIVNPMGGLMTTIPQQNQSLLGHKDDDGEFKGLFEQIENHMGRLVSSLTQQLGGVRGMLPFGQPTEMGKLTVIKAGPGFHEEKHFDIGPYGKLTEVEPIQMHDALEHANPMDTHFNSNDVEVFHDKDEDVAKNSESAITEAESEKVEKEPVMDVRGLEDQEPELPKAQVVQTVEDFGAKEYPFLSVLRNTVEENERISQQILSKYRAMAEEEYLDDNSCSSHHLKWSDWVACLHAKVGVPRWLTAATISLGIVFSVWLCLVIPSSAPKQRLRALVIKSEKPSAAVAKAKEAEAAAAAAAKAKEAEAAGFDAKDYVVAVVNVDMPPTYGDCGPVPGSPAPSYKSDMAAPVVPGSPAPSYRSVDIPVEKEEKDEKVDLEPVHEKKESVA